MRGRWIIAVLVVFALVAGTSYAWRYARQEVGEAVQRAVQHLEAAHLPERQVSTETQSLDTSPAARLTIENPYGPVTVSGGATTTSFESRVFARAATVEEAKRRASPFQVKTEAEPDGGQRIVVSAKADDPNPPYMMAKLTVRAPGATTLTVRARSGDIRVQGFTDGVTLENMSGDNVVYNCPGPVTASAASGGTRITGASRGATAETSSGSVRLEAVSGPVLARSMSGSVTVRAYRTSSIAASTASGSVDVRVTSPFSGHMEVSSMSGPIEVALPATSNCRIRTATLTGPTTCTLPLQRMERAGRNLSGQLGAGQGYVEVTSTSGGIVVRPL